MRRLDCRGRASKRDQRPQPPHRSRRLPFSHRSRQLDVGRRRARERAAARSSAHQPRLPKRGQGCRFVPPLPLVCGSVSALPFPGGGERAFEALGPRQPERGGGKLCRCLTGQRPAQVPTPP